MPAEPVVAAGAVVRRGAGADVELAIVHRPKYDDWSFPKGKREGREHTVTTAVREVAEETGLSVRLCRPLSPREYLVDGHPKVVHYWVAAPTRHDEPFLPNPEVDRLDWVTPAEAQRRLTQPHDAELVELALREPAGTAFVIVRHAKARKRGSWKGDDDDRPLTQVGRRDAKSLVPLLSAFGIQRLHTSPAIRCCQTLQPYARATRYPLVEEPSVGERAFDTDPVEGLDHTQLLLQQATADDAPAALCTHRPVIPALVGHLLEDSGITGPTETLPTASMVVLHAVPGRLLASELHTLG
jgi:8-oxo-(d)GTP phosphatase